MAKYNKRYDGIQHVQITNGDDSIHNKAIYKKEVDLRQNSVHWMMLKSTVKTILAMFPVIMSIALGWICIPYFIHQQISNKIVISPETNLELYSSWVHPTVPIYLKVYLFNVTNPKEIRYGGLPKLQEVGPYVFQENRTKVDILHNEASDTVTYKDHVSYHFREDLSGQASMEDVVTIINVPFAAAIFKTTHDLPWPLNDLAKTVLVSYKERLFIQRRVEETLFTGWKVPFLEKIEEDVGISLILNNTFGFFVGQNNTANGPYTVSRGTYDKPSFGKILKYKNESHLNYWGDATSSCNKIQGTDGTIFPPFVTKSTTLRIFNAELCRSISLTYNTTAHYKGIKGYRFTVPPTVLQDPREGGESQCYCSTFEDEWGECLKQGALNLRPCRDGAPVAISAPHFLDANPEYIEKSGLLPDRAKHGTFLDIEPMTGVVLQACKKFQINLILKRVKGISSLSKVPEILLPLMWADECASLDLNNIAMLKSALFIHWLVDIISKWGAVSVTLALSLFLVLKQVNTPMAKINKSTLVDSTPNIRVCMDSNASLYMADRFPTFAN